MSDKKPGPLTVRGALELGTGFLESRGSPSGRLDAEVLVAHAIGAVRLDLYTDPDRPLTPTERNTARDHLRRRGEREPVAYITGVRAFRGMDLHVTPDVLVPRPETEGLVEWAREAAPKEGRVLDYGTGSGAIALSLANERNGLEIVAVDVSPVALDIARENGAGAEVDFRESDGFAGLEGELFDIIVANPPYLSEADLESAPPELAFEPRGALVAGPEGTEAIDQLIAEAPAHMAPGALLAIEVGQGQSTHVAAALKAGGYESVEIRKDLAGIERLVGARR